MRKLVLKTIFVTVAAAVILAISVFGIASLCAPKAMMRLTASLGMESISGDYAYEEYERSQDLSCLSRSFLICAERGSDRLADERFTLLYEAEGFGEMCEKEDEKLSPHESVAASSYRAYLCGTAACVKYRLGAKESALSLAVFETDKTFPAGNPVICLALEVVKKADKEFAEALLAAMREAEYSGEDYDPIVKLLEDVI